MPEYHPRSIRLTDDLWDRLNRAYHAAAQASPETLSKSEWLARVLETGMRAHTPTVASFQAAPTSASASEPSPPSQRPASPPPSREQRRERRVEQLLQRTPPPLRRPAVQTSAEAVHAASVPPEPSAEPTP